MKTIVVGLGNPILGDDGVGWRVVEYAQQYSVIPDSARATVDYTCLAVGGLGLMEHLIGYDRAILIDAINLAKLPIGDIYCLRLADLPEFTASHTGSAHDTSLSTALQLGMDMGVPLPKDIQIIGVETSNTYDFSEQLSTKVAAAIPRAALILESLLNENPDVALS